jgi:hypothetical protein
MSLGGVGAQGIDVAALLLGEDDEEEEEEQQQQQPQAQPPQPQPQPAAPARRFVSQDNPLLRLVGTRGKEDVAAGAGAGGRRGNKAPLAVPAVPKLAAEQRQQQAALQELQRRRTRQRGGGDNGGDAVLPPGARAAGAAAAEAARAEVEDAPVTAALSALGAGAAAVAAMAAGGGKDGLLQRVGEFAPPPEEEEAGEKKKAYMTPREMLALLRDEKALAALQEDADVVAALAMPEEMEAKDVRVYGRVARLVRKDCVWKLRLHDCFLVTPGEEVLVERLEATIRHDF